MGGDILVNAKKPPIASLAPEERDARLRKILLSALGKAWMYWPPRAEAKRRCRVLDKPGWYACEMDPSHVVEKIEIDHISPCIKPTEGWQGWDAYITSRFVFNANQLQGLCTSCHKAKSKEENAVRREAKRVHSIGADDKGYQKRKPSRVRVRRKRPTQGNRH